MPELPEVEILVRHLAPLIQGKTIRDVIVRRERVLRPTTPPKFKRALKGAQFAGLTRRGKYLLFSLKRDSKPLTLLGHLGMTGRMYLAPKRAPLPKHAAVILGLGPQKFVFEDTRYFGRLTLDVAAVEDLGPEPLGQEFNAKYLAQSAGRSAQPIKVKLLDQSLVAGVGNIYASEALFRAGVSPLTPARQLTSAQISRLVDAIRTVMSAAIDSGSTVPLNYSGEKSADRLFYFGRAADSNGSFEERLLVYDRAGQPCPNCRNPIRRLVQAARSTFYCPKCQT